MIRNVCHGQRGEERVHTPMCHPFCKRKLSRKTGQVEQTPTFLEVKKESDKVHPDSLSLGKKFCLKHWLAPEKARLSIFHCFLKG